MEKTAEVERTAKETVERTTLKSAKDEVPAGSDARKAGETGDAAGVS